FRSTRRLSWGLAPPYRRRRPRAPWLDSPRQTETEPATIGANENPGNHAVFTTISGVCASEGDGTRTRNHRIDSPLSSRRKSKTAKEVAETASEPLAHTLACETQIDPDLARLIEAWPSLRPTVKRVILAALEMT